MELVKRSEENNERNRTDGVSLTAWQDAVV